MNSLPQKLKPHSQEWFDAYFTISPVQAELTRNLINRAGHDFICTTCGDPPLGDYFVEMTPYVTLRLCDSCLEIYVRTYGPQLIPVAEQDNENEAGTGSSSTGR